MYYKAGIHWISNSNTHCIRFDACQKPVESEMNPKNKCPKVICRCARVTMKCWQIRYCQDFRYFASSKTARLYTDRPPVAFFITKYLPSKFEDLSSSPLHTSNRQPKESHSDHFDLERLAKLCRSPPLFTYTQQRHGLFLRRAFQQQQPGR